MRERTPSALVDEYLVVQCQLKDATAFARLVRRWHPRIVRHAYRLTQDRDIAGDIAQDTWIAVVRGLSSLRDPARFKAWVLRIVANKARDWIRREQVRRRAVRQADADPGISGPERESGAVQRVRAELTRLGPDQRVVLTWHYLEEMPIREIAEALSIPEGTVKSRLYHARIALRSLLEDE